MSDGCAFEPPCQPTGFDLYVKALMLNGKAWAGSIPSHNTFNAYVIFVPEDANLADYVHRWNDQPILFMPTPRAEEQGERKSNFLDDSRA